MSAVSDAESGAVLGPGSHPAEPADLYAAAREQARALREGEHQDAAAKGVAEMSVREVFGAEYDAALRLVNQYIDGASPEARAELEGRVLADGTRALQDPATLLRLAVEALGPMPQLSNRTAIDREITALEKRIQTDRNGWLRDEKAQVRYRALLRMRQHTADAS